MKSFCPNKADQFKRQQLSLLINIKSTIEFALIAVAEELTYSLMLQKNASSIIKS